MKENICGYLVVRLPKKNFDLAGRGAFSSVCPKIDKIYYGGIDRMPWFDIDEKYYAKSLTEEIKLIRSKIHSQNNDLTGLYLTKDLHEAKRLLDISNSENVLNEIIAIYSEKLANIKGCIEIDEDIDWIGYDIVDLGNWSWMRDGMFFKPNEFNLFYQYLNPDGVFNEDFIISKHKEYINQYRLLSKKNILEPPIEKPYGLDFIKIGRLGKHL